MKDKVNKKTIEPIKDLGSIGGYKILNIEKINIKGKELLNVSFSNQTTAVMSEQDINE